MNGKEFSKKDDIQIEKDISNNNYSLTIPKLNPSVHSGQITIEAKNIVGSVKHDMKIDILGLLKFYGCL